ncbi:MAG: hypothetical protein ACC618_02750 [Patescibacteria group bacterium]
MRERTATEKDWISLQGGKPKVSVEDNLTTVTHNYPAGEGMVVRSHNSTEHYGTVKILVNDRLVEVPTALVKKFHGDPCELESVRAGGHGYDRENE